MFTVMGELETHPFQTIHIDHKRDPFGLLVRTTLYYGSKSIFSLQISASKFC